VEILLWLVVALRLLVPFNLPLTPTQYTIEIPNYVVPTDRIPSAAFFAASSDIPVAPFHTISLLQILSIVWIIGIVLVAGFHLISYWYCKSAYLRWSIRCIDQNILDRAEVIKNEIAIRTLPKIYICSNLPSPMIIGFSKQYLLLPDIIYDDADIDCILRHELVHWKRKDIWYKLLLLVVNSIHWFNPISYLLLREAAEDLEMLCDDFVLKGRGAADCKMYSKVILKAASQKHFHTTILSTSFHGGANSLRARLQNILTDKRRNGTVTYITACAAALVVSGLIICLPVNAATIVQLQDKTISIPNSVRGIDVSAYQGEINWEQVASSDIHFAFIRASYGLEPDEAFRENASNAHLQGLDIGAWHYATFTSRESMLQQADFFLKRLEDVELNLPAVLCIDTPTEISKESMTDLCIEFLKIVNDAGYPVMLNTYPLYLERYLDADQLQDIPKWIADYKDEPDCDQQFWQYTSNGTINGIEGQVDFNIAYAAIP